MKKLKSALLLALALILALSVNISSFGVLFAKVDGEFSGKFFADNVITRVKEGDDFIVPAPLSGVTREVLTPAGRKATAKSANTYTAAQLGHYKVTYTQTDGDAEYSYNVFCYEDREYYIRVNEKMENGNPVFIPTYLKKSVDKLTLPSFDLVYKNSRGEVVVVNNGDDNIYDDNGTMGISYSTDIASRAGRELTANFSGALNIVFWAKTGPDAVKKFTKEYTVLVQDTLDDNTPPKLNPISLTGTANLNALYTLPIVKAEDLYEKNPLVVVTVTDPLDNPVKEYKANDYGYADKATEGAAVPFDNKDVISFYPVLEGPYTVTYTAYDRYDHSSTHDYTINCSDTLAPVIVELADDIIPTKWGLTVSKKNMESDDDDAYETLTDTSFRLPMPVAVDNVDATDDLTLTINLISPANVTIGNWTGTIGDYKKDGVELTSIYNTYFKTEHKNKLLKPDADGIMTFSFEYLDFSDENNHGGHTSLNEDREKFGDWTWSFQVKDTKNNGGSGNAKKSVILNLAHSFSDIKLPEVDENNLDIPKYVLIKDDKDTFDVPNIPLFPDDDTRLTSKYSMSSTGSIIVAGITKTIEIDGVAHSIIELDGIEYTVINEFEVKGGESYKIEKIGANYYMLIAKDNKDFAFALSSSDPKVSFEFWAIDDVGNRSVVKNDNGDISKNPDGSFVNKTFSIKILYSGSIQQDNIFLAESDAADAAEGAAFNLNNGEQGVAKTLGGFVIQNVEEIEYTGVEINITDKDGKPVSFSAYVYNRGFILDGVLRPATSNETPEIYNIYVDGIKLTPKASGLHRVNIRVYDISGKSSVYGYYFEADETINEGGIIGTPGTAAAKLGEKGVVRTEYELEKTFRVGKMSVENVVVRYIDGFSFGIMNNVFIGFNTGAYSIAEYVIEDFSDFAAWLAQSKQERAQDHRKSYSVSLTNNEKPVIELDNIIPKYQAALPKPVSSTVYEEGKFIVLPEITAFTSFETAEVKVKVEFNSSPVTVSKVYEDAAGNFTFKAKEGDVDNYFTKRWAFPTLSEGNYNVTITATASSGVETLTKVIEVGDRTPPSFNVAPPLKATVGTTFLRTAITDVSGDIIRIEITLKDKATGSTVTEAGGSYASVEELLKHLESEYEFIDPGFYTLTYEVVGRNNRSSILSFEIEVTASSTKPDEPLLALTIVLIIIGVLLILGLIVYWVRFRVVKK